MSKSDIPEPPPGVDPGSFSTSPPTNNNSYLSSPTDESGIQGFLDDMGSQSLNQQRLWGVYKSYWANCFNWGQGIC